MAAVLRSLIRRRSVAVLVVGALVAAGGILLVREQAGVYSSRAEVVVLPPTPERASTLDTSGDSLVEFAAVLERRYNGGSTRTRYASVEATLAGGGVTDGSSVRLVDNGGQWATNFNEPILIVEAVAPSADVVRSRMYGAFSGLAAAASALQSGVPAAQQMTLLRPDRVGVAYSAGNRNRAIAGVLLLAVLAMAATASAPPYRRRGPVRRPVHSVA